MNNYWDNLIESVKREKRFKWYHKCLNWTIVLFTGLLLAYCFATLF